MHLSGRGATDEIEDTPLEEGNPIARIRRPHHERVEYWVGGAFSAGCRVCPAGHRTSSYRDMERVADRCRRSRPTRAFRIWLQGLASLADHVRTRGARRRRDAG